MLRAVTKATGYLGCMLQHISTRTIVLVFCVSPLLLLSLFLSLSCVCFLVLVYARLLTRARVFVVCVCTFLLCGGGFRFEAVQSLVRSVRNAKAEYKVEPGKKIPAVVQVIAVT